MNQANENFNSPKNKDKKTHRKYVLRLYVAGMTPRSLKAVTTIRKICEDYLHEGYDLKVIDIYKQPELAKTDQIIAVPTLIRKSPEPLRKFIGDLSETDKVMLGLDLKIPKDTL